MNTKHPRLDRIRVVRDGDGNILVATPAGTVRAEETTSPPAASTEAPRLHHGDPITAGHTATEVEIPDDWAHLTLNEVVQKLINSPQLTKK